ncbi:hypothetical protein GCM10009799_07630 [Nocardiopsis rhodophaea]|uniref:Interferon-induced transmembrane protein n=1 Tax=Nocardiopsis rhodophaea TaxID=280238 RepID=A0ABN2SDS6_9ACTN
MSYGPPPGDDPPPPGGGYGPPPGGTGDDPGMPMGGPPPDNWLVPAILATAFCCLPFGVVGIVFAAQVNDRWNRGDYAGAHEAADQARKWTLASIIAIVVLVVLLFGVPFLLVAASGEL